MFSLSQWGIYRGDVQKNKTIYNITLITYQTGRFETKITHVTDRIYSINATHSILVKGKAFPLQAFGVQKVLGC
jgi:hypothetical protein